jgi:hypothetical protein
VGRADPDTYGSLMQIDACIPSIGRSPYVYDLANNLVAEGVSVRVYINDSLAHDNFEMRRFSPGVGFLGMHGYSIYDEWNVAAREARASGSFLLLLNDDIEVPPHLAETLAYALHSNPEYGLISVQHHVLQLTPSDVYPISHQAGTRRAFMPWCCIARPSMWQEVDPRYRIWYGDDDLIWKMNAAGHLVGVLRGTGATHHMSTTLRQLPWVTNAAKKDAELWTTTGH